jgi:putative ABC transport system permease protein
VLKVTLKGLLAYRGRVVLTVVAVMIGVALVAGTLMLTDAVGRSVRQFTASAHAGVDVVVRNADDAKAGPPQPIGPHLAATIRALPGVGAAAGVVVGEKLQMVGRDGRPIRHRRAVNLVTSWPSDPALASGYTLRQGRPPTGSGEVVLDAATAATGGWRLGDTLGIVGADGGVHRFRVVGVTGFAGRDSPPRSWTASTPLRSRCSRPSPRSGYLAGATAWTRWTCAPLPGCARRRCATGSRGCCRQGGWRR